MGIIVDPKVCCLYIGLVTSFSKVMADVDEPFYFFDRYAAVEGDAYPM